MAVREYFAHSYSEARTNSLAAACTAGSHLARYVLPNIRGPNDEDLISTWHCLVPKILRIYLC